MFEAVLWDFGGVITTSPFDAFAEYERELGLEAGFIRSVNATDPDRNAWARLERREVDPAEFADLFEQEARARGGELSGVRVLELLAGQLRREMVRALQRVRAAGLRTGCITNNFDGFGADRDHTTSEGAAVMGLFDVVVESREVGVRKPEPRIYEIACERLGVAPAACVFLDDLGVNLKPARAMGMRTIKVESADDALTELEAVLGIDLRRDA